MDYAIVLPTPADSWRIALRAEELGFSAAWFYDTQLLSADVFVGMAAAAMKTSRIRLGTGVLIPSNRIVPVTANALASLNRLAPGRIDFGVGTGFTARRAMGLGPIKLAGMADYIGQVYGMLAGKTVTCTIEGKECKVRFLNPELGLINTDDPIPLHVSAFGPNSRRLTAKLGAGWINFFRNAASARAAIEDMQTAWAEAHHEKAGLRSTLFTMGCVLSPDEPADSPRAKAQAAPIVTATVHRAVEEGIRPEDLPADIRNAVATFSRIYERYEPADARYLTMHRGHLLFLRPEEAPLISAELIRNRTLTGTIEEIRDVIRQLAEFGYTQLAVQIVPGHETALEEWAQVFESV